MLMSDPAEKPAYSSPTVLRAPPQVPMLPPASLRPLRLLLALYIFLWVFEGALRKWIVPSMANPLLIIRDPVLLLLYVLAIARNAFPWNFMVGWIIGLGAIAFGLSYTATNLPLSVQLYGLRADYIHLPLIFLMPKLIDRDGVKLVGKWILIIGPPMALLVVLQFLSPSGGFLNNGAGGGTNGMLDSAYGHVRPSGTFSFTNGLTGFSMLVTAFYIYHLLEGRVYPRLLWMAAGPAALVLLTLSGSRIAIGLAGLIMASVIFICTLKARYWQPALKLILVGVLAVVALGSFAIFKDGLSIFAYRFGSSANVRTGFFGRFAQSITDPYDMLKQVPLSGVGLGMGTNVAAVLLTGKRDFLVAEGEWPRVLMENGPVVGVAFLFLRAVIVAYLAVASLRSLQRYANTLPFLIFTGCFLEILQGQFSQATALGFATIAGGLCLAACQMPFVPKASETAANASPSSVAPPRVVPGRSLLAGQAQPGPSLGRQTQANVAETIPDEPCANYHRATRTLDLCGKAA